MNVNKSSECDNEILRKEIGNDDLHFSLLSIKECLEVDLYIQNFDNQSFVVNNVLNKHGLLLKVYELKEILIINCKKFK